ncbi:MAG TPA: DMT family transporter [Kofleriaceae bacterium]|nr:DMT family transporter [Kofleriaceae bacterium]
MSRTPWSVHLILLAGQICFASLPVVGRLAIGHVPPAGIVVVRMAGGAIVFTLVAAQRRTLRVARGDLPLIVLSALLGNVINQEMFIHGLARTTATNAVVLGSTIPVFTALVAIVLGRERIKVLRLLGMAVAFGGVAALVGAEELSTSSEHFVGSVMVLINALSYGSYLVIVRPLAERYDPIALLALMFLVGTPIVAPFGIHAFAETPALVTSDYLFLAFLIAVPTVGAYGLVQTALRRTESSLVAAYIYLQPVFATIGAMFVLGEDVGLRTVVCGAIVLAGVWLAARAK